MKKLLEYKKMEKKGIKLGKKLFKLYTEKKELDSNCKSLNELLNAFNFQSINVFKQRTNC
jgi:hypothetical protein